MEKDVKKKLKEALKSEINPLLIGLRNEIKSLSVVLKKILDKAPPDIQKSEITNYPESPDVSKVKVINPEPKVKEVKVINQPEPIKISFIGTLIKKMMSMSADSVKTLEGSILNVSKKFKEGLDGLKSTIFKVNVENQKEIEFPDIQKVEVTNPIKQKEVQRVKIENSQPSEAIPVVLTTRDKKRLYDTLFQLVGGGSNLGNLKRKLDEIKTVLENLEITINAGDISIGAVELKDETTDDRVNVTNDGGKNAAFVQSNSLSQEATQLLVKSELTAIKGFVDGLEALLTSLDGKDFATETTLALLEGKDFATETTLALVKSELTLIKGFVDGLEALLTSIDGKDFATETTLLTIKSELTAIKGFVDGIETKLDTLIAKDFATETTLAKIDVAQGAKTDVEATGDGSVIALLKRIRTLLANIPLLSFIGDRLKVDAEVTVTPDPRPGLRFAEFLESGGSRDMNVDGSTTPVIFSASPPTGKKWFIHSINIVLQDESINFLKFGGITGGLTNGIEFRIKEGGLTEVTLGTFKLNRDFFVFTTDIELQSAASDILAISNNFKVSSGTTFELADANSEIFKVIVNDDLTSINGFVILIKGFEVDE